MNISFEHGKVYVDNVRFAFYEVQHGADLLPGIYPVEARYSHHHGRALPHVDGYGWIGSSAGCAIVLGQVRGRSNLIPDGRLVRILTENIECAVEFGGNVLCEVK